MASRRGSDLLRFALAVGSLFGAARVAAAQAPCPEVPDCSPRIVWPPNGAEIPVNPRIVIEGCPEQDLAASRPVLMSAQDQVPLRLVERLAGSSHSFRPALLLQPATRYALVLREPPPDVSYEVPVWTTRDATDTTPPSWAGAPRVSDPESTATLDGTVSISLELPLGPGNEPLAALVQVSREPRGMAPVERARLLAIERTETGARVRLAGGRCTGWPRLAEPGPYSVRLVLVDPAGNRSPAETLGLRVPPPPEPREGRAVTVLSDTDFVRTKLEPEYTPSALEAALTGVVSGRLLVDDRGFVRSVSVESRLPMGLDEETVKALFQWRFHPSDQPERRLAFETHFLLVPTAYDPGWNLEPDER